MNRMLSAIVPLIAATISLPVHADVNLQSTPIPGLCTQQWRHRTRAASPPGLAAVRVLNGRLRMEVIDGSVYLESSRPLTGDFTITVPLASTQPPSKAEGGQTDVLVNLLGPTGGDATAHAVLSFWEQMEARVGVGSEPSTPSTRSWQFVTVRLSRVGTLVTVSLQYPDGTEIRRTTRSADPLRVGLYIQSGAGFATEIDSITVTGTGPGQLTTDDYTCM